MMLGLLPMVMLFTATDALGQSARSSRTIIENAPVINVPVPEKKMEAKQTLTDEEIQAMRATRAKACVFEGTNAKKQQLVKGEKQDPVARKTNEKNTLLPAPTFTSDPALDKAKKMKGLATKYLEDNNLKFMTTSVYQGLSESDKNSADAKDFIITDLSPIDYIIQKGYIK